MSENFEFSIYTLKKYAEIGQYNFLQLSLGQKFW